jgi:fatty acid desaturase
MTTENETATDREAREQAVRQLKKQRDFRSQLVAYVLVNALLVVIWALTSRSVFFWPAFVMVGWGIGLAMTAWDAFGRKAIGESQIQQEMSRMNRDKR